MKDSIKNIVNLNKLFIKENNKFNLIDMENKKLNKKSLLFWVYIILIFGILYISMQIVDYVAKTGKPEIFLNGFLLFLEILVIIRTIMLSLNVFYFSKDIENILHLPFKPIEILIAKFNTILFMVYEIELLFGIIPLIIYGATIGVGLNYFINLIILLILFPIFAILIVSIIMIILMKTIKVFKNKDLMQIIISFAMIFIVMFLAGKLIEYVFTNKEYIENNQQALIENINNKLIRVNDYFVNINPTREILETKSILTILLNYIKLILINLVGFLLFAFLGNKLYLKQLLKANFYFKNKRKKDIKLNKKVKKNKIGIAYIKKEFKILIKNPMFFIQTIYPVVMITILACVLLSTLIPQYVNLLEQEEYKEMAESLKFDFEAACIIIGGIQIIGLLNYSSITAFSREGKNAYVIKYLPISVYKQYIYKNIPQILVNIICSVGILAVLKWKIPAIENKYILMIFILSTLLILINSFILTLIDLLRPKLEWDAEYEILKNNKNKLLQYVLLIFNVVFLIFMKYIFIKHNLDISLIIFAIILLIIFVILNGMISKFKNRLFKQIG